VGAVVADSSGREVGAGTHTYDGVKHAEILALEQAGTAARGGTLYLNLEPCSHQGRTGRAPMTLSPPESVAWSAPCRIRIRWSRRGFAKLRAMDISVQVGLFEAEARKLNEGFAKYIRRGKRWSH